MTRGVRKMISSVREVVIDLEPNSAPIIGILYSRGMPPELSAYFSMMMPPIATVSPSCTVIWVETERLEKDDDWTAVFTPSGGGSGALTCWSMIFVTMPLELARPTIEKVTPVLALPMVLANGVVPPTVTPPTADCDVSTGT